MNFCRCISSVLPSSSRVSVVSGTDRTASPVSPSTKKWKLFEPKHRSLFLVTTSVPFQA
jgi:hypothetical protein